MVGAAIAMAVCRQAAAARLKRGYSANWQKGGFNLFAVVLAISSVMLVYDRVTAASHEREAAAAAQDRAMRQQRDDDYERQIAAVRTNAMQQSAHTMTQQARGFQINPGSGSTNSSGGQANR